MAKEYIYILLLNFAANSKNEKTSLISFNRNVYTETWVYGFEAGCKGISVFAY